MAKDRRCGKCSGCRATPQRPCRDWVAAACERLKRELESPAMQEALKQFIAEQPEQKLAALMRRLLGRWQIRTEPLGLRAEFRVRDVYADQGGAAQVRVYYNGAVRTMPASEFIGMIEDERNQARYLGK